MIYFEQLTSMYICIIRQHDNLRRMIPEGGRQKFLPTFPRNSAGESAETFVSYPRPSMSQTLSVKIRKAYRQSYSR